MDNHQKTAESIHVNSIFSIVVNFNWTAAFLYGVTGRAPLSFGMSFLLIPFFTCANFKEIAGQVQHSPYQNIQDGLKPADR